MREVLTDSDFLGWATVCVVLLAIIWAISYGLAGDRALSRHMVDKGYCYAKVDRIGQTSTFEWRKCQ